MSKISVLHTNFTAGEFSPQLEGRVDIAKYGNGAKTLENIIVKSPGGAFRRPGSYYVAEVKDSTKSTRIISFQFSTEQAYIIELGDQYMRFYKDSGQILYGGSPYEISTPYLEADLFQLQFAQSADVLYIVHKNYPVYKLSRTGHTSWTLTKVLFTNGPYLPSNLTATTIDASAVTGAISLVASADLFNIGHIGAYFRIKTGYVLITAVTDSLNASATVEVTLPDHTATADWSEGSWSEYRGYPSCVSFYEQRLCFAATTYEPQTIWGSCTEDYENFDAGTGLDDESITYTIATEQVNAIQWLSAGKKLAVGTAGGCFNLSGSSTDTALTPTNVSVARETTYGSMKLMPKRINNYLYYVQKNARTVREFIYNWTQDSFIASDMTLLSEHITESGIVDMDYQESPDNIMWFVRADGEMAILTRQTEQEVAAWARIKTDGDYKSVAVIPNGEEDQVWTIVERTINSATKKYVEYFWERAVPSDQQDCFFVDSGLTLEAAEIAITGISKAAVAVVTAPGHGFANGNHIKINDVVGMTEVNARHYIVANITPTTFELTDTSGNNVDSTAYTTYVSGGVAQREYQVISGLSHLEAKSVAILVNGATHPAKTVASGAVTLDDYYSVIHIGLGYTSIIETLRVEEKTAMGSAQNVIKRAYKAMIRFYKSLGCKIGISTTQDIVHFRTTAMVMSYPPSLFTGDKEIQFPAGYDKDGRIYIIQEQPLPLNVIMLAIKFEMAEV